MVVAIKKRSLSSSGQSMKTQLQTSDILERIHVASLKGRQRGSWKDDSQTSFGSLLTATTSGSSSSSCGNVLPRTRQDLFPGREEVHAVHAPKTERKLASNKYEKVNKTATIEGALPLFDICQTENISGESINHSPRSSKDNSSPRVPSSLLRPSRYSGSQNSSPADPKGPSSSTSSRCSGSSFSSSSTTSSSSSSGDGICNLRRRIRHHQRRMSSLTDYQSLSGGYSGANDPSDDNKSHCSARSAPGRIKAASKVRAKPLPPLPLTTTVSPGPTKIGSHQSLVTKILFYTFAVALVGVTALNKHHSLSLARHLNAVRTHTLSAQHHLTTATLELRAYDEYLHSLESFGTNLRSELDALATDVDTRSRRLTEEDTKVMNDHEIFIEQMKKRQRSRREKMETLKSRVKEAARIALVDKYGHGINDRYHIEVTVSANFNYDHQTSFIIETNSLSHASHTVHHFMEQIDSKLWNEGKFAFTSNPGHLIHATPTGDDVSKEFAAKGLDRLIVDESPNASTRELVRRRSNGENGDGHKALQHEAYTVAFPTSHIGLKSSEVGFYINTQDNTGVHDSDAIIGTIISGREVIQRIMAIIAMPGESGGSVEIVRARIL